MIIFLFCGLIFVIGLICLAALCCFFGKEIFQALGRLDGTAEYLQANRASSLVRGLGAVLYNPEQFQHTDECIICLEAFKSDSEITVLKCDPKHYFHTECIAQSIQGGHFVCPICRAPIEDED